MRKREYLKEKIRQNELNIMPRKKILYLFCYYCCCCKIFKPSTCKEELEKTEQKLKKTFKEIVKMKKTNVNLKKIYITFSSYEIKKSLKTKSILINNENYTLKKADLHPHDIKWENLNINKCERFLRCLFSYVMLVCFILLFFF